MVGAGKLFEAGGFQGLGILEREELGVKGSRDKLAYCTILPQTGRDRVYSEMFHRVSWELFAQH